MFDNAGTTIYSFKVYVNKESEKFIKKAEYSFDRDGKIVVVN